jgi:predicted helicase
MTENQKDKPHQREATKNVVHGFKSNDRGQVVMACGTGKTRVGTRVAEALDARLVLILVPSISLIAQMIREWRQNYDGHIEILGVCSDYTTSAGGSAAERGMDKKELERVTGIEVTTAPDIIAAFMRLKGDRVVICTYQSSNSVELAQLRTKVPTFDLAIADEAHRTAGQLDSQFATIVRPHSIRAKKRLFMTATPKMFGAQRNSDGELIAVQTSSMNDIRLYGPVFHRLGFNEAVRKGLLVDWEVVVSIVYDDDIEKLISSRSHVKVSKQPFIARDIALHIALNRAAKNNRLKKIITFHNRVAKADDFAAYHNALTMRFPKSLRIKNQWIKHVSAYMPSSERLSIQNEFAALGRDTTAIITNAQCLTEGVDIPAVDAVMFNDPKQSVIAIVQAIGRAMRISPMKNKGLIVVPVFVPGKRAQHTTGQRVWDDVMDGTAFNAMRNVMLAMKSSDDAFGAVMSSVSRRKLRNTGGTILTEAQSKPGIRDGKMIEAPEDENIVTHVKNGKAYNSAGKQVVITLPKNISIVGIDGGKLGANFLKAIVNRTVRWVIDNDEYRAELIAAFIKEHKRYPSNVRGREEKKLASWINEFRRKKKNDK